MGCDGWALLVFRSFIPWNSVASFWGEQIVLEVWFRQSVNNVKVGYRATVGAAEALLHTFRWCFEEMCSLHIICVVGKSARIGDDFEEENV